MATGLVTNAIGSLGGLDKFLPIKSNDDNIIDTSSNQINNNILQNSNDNIQSEEELNKLKKEKETTVKTKVYDAQFI